VETLRNRYGASLLACGLVGCGVSDASSGADHGGTAGTGNEGGSSDGDTDDVPADPVDDRLWVTHAFGRVNMAPFEDRNVDCVSWTVQNELPLYAQSVLVSNEGSFHHSNWFVVPDTVYDGPDGYWPCDERGYSELDAGNKGSVLFAQSTQSYVEEQTLAPGAVVKIPTRSRIVAGVHTLNASPREEQSGLWLSLSPIHPAEVETVVTPLALEYKDIHLPANQESRLTASCDFESAHEASTGGEPLSLKLHYILPHYHYLGNYFDVTVVGGELDGQSVFELDGFNADANGLTFDPPMDLPGATGLQMTCGYDNWTSQDVEWGYGDGEMCVLMALVEADTVMAGSVQLGSTIAGVEDDVHMYEGPCIAFSIPKNEDQGMPTQEEIVAPLYLPPVDPEDQGLPPIPECSDADPGAAPDAPATLSSLQETIFAPACTYASCHGQGAAGQLDLRAPDLHARLLGHELLVSPGMPLVDPGNPDNSWLYHLLSKCEPTLPGGVVVSHMPKNAPKLLDDEVVAQLRAWIEAGALDD
jgi:hypothetical protein